MEYSYPTIIASVFVFSSIIMILVLILNYAEKKLLPQGDVRVIINGDEEKSPIIKPGGTLLSTLANESVFLAS